MFRYAYIYILDDIIVALPAFEEKSYLLKKLLETLMFCEYNCQLTLLLMLVYRTNLLIV